MIKKLTAKQVIFVEEYLKDLNATQAAIRAGYSEKTANPAASRLLANVSVQAAIAKAKSERVERIKIDSDYVLNRLHQIDEMDVLDIMNDDLSLKPLSDWPVEWRKTISGVDISVVKIGENDESIIKKIKWPDKVKNLELLGRHTDVKAWDKDAIKAPEKQEPIVIVRATGAN